MNSRTEQQRMSEISDEGAAFALFREMDDLRVICRLTIEGEPASKARARFTGYGSPTRAYTPGKTKQAEEVIAWQFRAKAPDWEVDAVSHFGVFALFFAATRQRRDVDNMLKLVLDGLNGVVWKDDVQVAEVSARVTRGCDEGRTELVIYRVPRVNPAPTRACEHCGRDFNTYASLAEQRYCSRVCDQAVRRLRRTRTCEACGAAYEGRPASKYCSTACSSAHRRVELTCMHCGTSFTKPKSLVRAGRPFCSRACQQSYWREHRTAAAKGTCATCGGPTSKKSYTNCRGCAVHVQRGDVDGVVDAGVLPDDSDPYLIGPDLRAGEPIPRKPYGPAGQVVLVIREVS